MESRLPSVLADDNSPEPISAGVGQLLALLATLICAAALFRVLYGLFALRSLQVLAGLVLAAGGAYLFVWVARRSEEWRLPVAAASTAAAIYYAWRARVASEIMLKRFRGLASSHMYGEHTGAFLTALLLFVVAVTAFGLHLLRSREE